MTNLITKAKDFYTGHKKLVVVLGILFLILLPQLTTSNYVRAFWPASSCTPPSPAA